MENTEKKPSLGQQLSTIVQSAVDADSRIPYQTMEEMVTASGFDFSEHGFDDLKSLLIELYSAFELDESETGCMVHIKKLPKEAPEVQKKEEEIQTSLVPKESSKKMDVTRGKSLNSWITSQIRANDGEVLISRLGQAMKDEGIQLPDKQSLTAYIKLYPDLFELCLNEKKVSYVKCVGEPVAKVPASSAAESVENVQPAVTSSPKKYYSLYNLFDFAHFSDYAQVKKQLSELAGNSGEDWFVLPDPQERDQYVMLDYKLRNNYAMTVHRQTAGLESGISLNLDSAEFDTGFVTSEGQHIIMCFKLNRLRDKAIWQNWVFDRIITK